MTKMSSPERTAQATRARQIREEMRALIDEYLHLKSMDSIDLNPEDFELCEDHEKDPEMPQEVPTGIVQLLVTDWVLVAAQAGYDSIGMTWSGQAYVYSDQGLADWKVKGLLSSHLDGM